MSGPPSLHMSHEGEHRHPRHDPGAHSMRVAAARRLGQLLGRDRSSQRAARRVDAPPRVQLGRAAHPRCRRCGGRRCRDRASRSVLLSVIGGAMLEFVFGHSRCRCGGLGDGGGVRGLLDLRLHRRRRVPFQARRGGAHERRPYTPWSMRCAPHTLLGRPFAPCSRPRLFPSLPERSGARLMRAGARSAPDLCARREARARREAEDLQGSPARRAAPIASGAILSVERVRHSPARSLEAVAPPTRTRRDLTRVAGRALRSPLARAARVS